LSLDRTAKGNPGKEGTGGDHFLPVFAKFLGCRTNNQVELEEKFN